MLRIGMDGYTEKARKILRTAHRFRNIIHLHPELKVMGDPSMIVAFNSADTDALNIMHISDVMKQLQPPWRFNSVQNPAGLHFCITGPQTWGETDSDQCLNENARNDTIRVEALYSSFSNATQMFSVDLSQAVPAALELKKKGTPALTGSMYGMGAAGIPIEDLTVTDNILQGAKHVMLQPVDNGLEPLYQTGRHIVQKNTAEKLGLPAY